MNLAEFLLMLVKFGVTFAEPLVAQAFKDWQDDKITAEEADVAAEGKFSAMMFALKDPAAEEAARAAETERRLRKKFDVSDATPTNDKSTPEK